jgi:hypothetical protein
MMAVKVYGFHFNGMLSATLTHETEVGEHIKAHEKTNPHS